MSLDEAEYRRLADLEAHPEQIAKNLQLPNTVASELANLKLRLEKLENEGFSEGSEKERTKNHRYSESVAIAQLVAQETRLNNEEKATYALLLQKAYFTNSDVDTLNQFHSGSWHKLSDQGKAEVAQRVQEGVERGELDPGRFSELYSDITALKAPDSEIERDLDKQKNDAADLMDLPTFSSSPFELPNSSDKGDSNSFTR